MSWVDERAARGSRDAALVGIHRVKAALLRYLLLPFGVPVACIARNV